MANVQGKKYIYGSPATLALYSSTNGAAVMTGYVSPDMESYDLSHESDTEEVKNSAGEVVGHIAYNNRLTLTVNFVPASATSVDLAKLTAQLPDANGTCIISGAPVIVAGGYPDAINADTSNRWIYSGGGSIKTTNTGKATGTITLKRYAGITATGSATVLGT
jgi:hypothetical protein